MTLVIPQPTPQYDRSIATRTKQLIEAEDVRNRKRGADLELGAERLIIRSPNGTRYQLSVSNTGDVFAAPAVVSGNAAQPAAQSCRIYLNANQTGVASATSTKINFDTVDFDPSGIADVATNHRITPTVAGTYLVGVGFVALPSGGTISGYLIASIVKSGTVVSQGVVQLPSNSESGMIKTELVQMNGTTDYIEGRGYVVVTAGTATFEAAKAITHLSCARVGP